jgi:hypothetical protein
MSPSHERPWTVLFIGLALLAVMALLGVVLATRDGARSVSEGVPPGGSTPDPADMLRIDEGRAFVVPAGRVLAINGIVTRETWSDATQVVIRFDGATVFQRAMFAGDVVTLPPGLAAAAGTLVEVDRLSPAADSRVTLLCHLSGLR